MVKIGDRVLLIADSGEGHDDPHSRYLPMTRSAVIIHRPPKDESKLQPLHYQQSATPRYLPMTRSAAIIHRPPKDESKVAASPLSAFSNTRSPISNIVRNYPYKYGGQEAFIGIVASDGETRRSGVADR
jgi:hypothetical protein